MHTNSLVMVRQHATTVKAKMLTLDPQQWFLQWRVWGLFSFCQSCDSRAFKWTGYSGTRGCMHWLKWDSGLIIIYKEWSSREDKRRGNWWWIRLKDTYRLLCVCRTVQCSAAQWKIFLFAPTAVSTDGFIYSWSSVSVLFSFQVNCGEAAQRKAAVQRAVFMVDNERCGQACKDSVAWCCWNVTWTKHLIC